MKIWEPKISWSDCVLLTRKMNSTQEEIAVHLSRGKDERGILLDDSMLQVSIRDLKEVVDRLVAKC